ncbi:superoxide dismutase family protein [Lentibacillus cibarius]|uniref:Superoxide dismutase [Cu-Zn] n=1 Tax=Lentibacillus cibarius TaxID=2583219 RepID=A0A5S3R7X0_9BACI|nr:superoxide dismutase family protein [Lentibacillus cibarius]TMN22903.1 superoxide dismutase family protein [Lentibacillus cibarius]
MKRVVVLLFLLTIVAVLTACGDNEDDDNGNTQNNADQEDKAVEQDDDSEDSEEIQVDLQNGDKESVGIATLEEESDGVEVTIEGENLPKGTHAFHVHEKGVCEAPDFKSAGGHFNPGDTDHGFDTPNGPHAGDMPNIAVGEDGTVEQTFLLKNVTLDKNDDLSLLGENGTALVIHEGADDGKSQPSGDAGSRLACGSISK